MAETLVSDLHTEHAAGLANKIISLNVRYTIPSLYYHSQSIYDLERRAIFSKRWILLSHSARFRKCGDFVKFEIAGYEFIVVKERSGKIVGFHNICRHRAYPVVQKASGTASVLSCKYHGWTYGLDGHLMKAPRFGPESTPGFDRSTMGLFPVHIHVDRNGFIYANLDAANTPETAWSDQYGAMDLEDRFVKSGIDWEKIEYDLTWTQNGEFNWKLMQENYNECYHCLTVHPNIAATTNLDTYYVDPAPGSYAYMSHFFEPKSTTTSGFDRKRFNGRSTTYVGPVGHITINPGTGLLYLMRCVPSGPRSTRQEYDVFKLHTQQADEQNRLTLLEFYKRVESEDIELCNGTQKNLERGIYQVGPLHPYREEGVIAFHEMYKEHMLDHVRLEQESNGKIEPATPVSAVDESCDQACSMITKHSCVMGVDSLEW